MQKRFSFPASEPPAATAESGVSGRRRSGDVYETLRSVGVVPDHGEEWVDIEMLDARDAAVLGCAEGAPFLRSRRLARDAGGQPIEYVTSLLNPAHFALHLEF